MTDRIFQCCYTNVTQETGGRVSSGWQTVAVSGDIPTEAYKRCERLQTANSAIQGSMTDEDGGPLNLLEICGDERYIYIIRTQYGNLVDRLGRANMFSHGFILPWKDVLSDPNSFLPVMDRGNFRENEEEARALLEKEGLDHAGPWEYSIESALEAAAVKPKDYPTLIQCVYAQMSDRKIQEPLYIQCSGEEQMRALLFCIYYGLPFYLRRKLHAASAAGTNAAGKNIIFSRLAGKHTYYIDPASGKNTVLSARTQKKITRYGFIDYAAVNLDAADYFARLEAEATSLGDASGSNELFLKLAHKRLGGMTVEGCSRDDLYESLSDALRSHAYRSADMRDFITRMMERVVRERCSLTEENRLDLADWENACALTEEEEQEVAALAAERQGSDAQKQEAAAQLQAQYDERKRRCREEARNEIYAGRDAGIAKICEVLDAELKKQITAKAYVEVLDTLKVWRDQERKKGEMTIARNAAIKIENVRKNLLDQGQDFKIWEPQIVRQIEKMQSEQLRSLNERLDAEFTASQRRQYRETKEKLERIYAAKKAEECGKLQREADETLRKRCRELDTELDRKMDAELRKIHAQTQSDLESGLPSELRVVESKMRLLQAIERYTIFFLLDLPTAEAVRIFDGMEVDRRLRYRDLLAEQEKGKVLLDSYYDSMFDNQTLSWEFLYRVLNVSSQDGKCPWTLREKIRNLTEEMYAKSLEEGADASAYAKYMGLMERVLFADQAVEYGKIAKRKFWEHFSLENFSMEAVQDYKTMAVSTERCKMVGNFYNLVGKLPSSTEEDFLSSVQAFFARARDSFRSGEEVFASDYVHDAAVKQYGSDDPLVAEWVKLALLVETEQLWRKLLVVRKDLYNMRYGDLLNSYDQFLGNGASRSGKVIRQINEIVLRFCSRKDSAGTPVPLDVWLTFSGAVEKESGNIFAVFDGGKDAVCMAGVFESDAVPESKLLGSRRYRGAAKEYIQGHGKESRKVKKWLNERTAPVKPQRGGKREERKGLFGR